MISIVVLAPQTLLSCIPKSRLWPLSVSGLCSYLSSWLLIHYKHIAQRNLQVFNLELKTKIKSHMMSEDVVFWKWLDNKTIGLVTERNVYRWSIEGDSAPQKIFERHASLSDSQIINLRASSDEKWYVLVGIASREGRVGGYMQLYSKERGVSQPIEGHAAAFAELTLEDAAHPTKLFTFAVRSPSNLSAKVISTLNVLHIQPN